MPIILEYYIYTVLSLHELWCSVHFFIWFHNSQYCILKVWHHCIFYINRLYSSKCMNCSVITYLVLLKSIPCVAAWVLEIPERVSGSRIVCIHGELDSPVPASLEFSLPSPLPRIAEPEAHEPAPEATEGHKATLAHRTYLHMVEI